MEFFDNKLCISFRELVDGGIMTVPNYKYMASSGRIKVARRGGGAKGNGACLLPRFENGFIRWQTQSVKHKVAYVLMMDGISFRYTEETGIVFSAPDFYVKNLIRRLMSCYGVSLKPIINEFK